MKSKTLRTITVVGVLAVITLAFFANIGIGTLSAPGFNEISILCPLGALTTMLATKVMVPRAVISVILMVLLIIVFARAFCAWICPIPLVSKIRNLFTKKKPLQGAGIAAPAPSSGGSELEREGYADFEQAEDEVRAEAIPLSDEERAALSVGCGSDKVSEPSCASGKKDKAACASCASKRGSVPDARHFVLGGALASTAIFGFPVFCLVCPIGLTFATIFLVIRLFGSGDVTWSLIFVPLLLIAEVVLFRKWCHRLCPLSAMMSLIGKANKTFKPTIDDSKCLETSKGIECGLCGKACEENIDPRHYDTSEAAWSECTKCRACVDVCPAKAIKMPLLPKRRKKPESTTMSTP